MPTLRARPSGTRKKWFYFSSEDDWNDYFHRHNPHMDHDNDAWDDDAGTHEDVFFDLEFVDGTDEEQELWETLECDSWTMSVFFDDLYRMQMNHIMGTRMGESHA